MTTEIIQIFLANGEAKNVRVDSFTTVQRILHVVLEGIGVDRLSFGNFALRLCTVGSGGPGSTEEDCRWLHWSLRMPQIARYYVEPQAKGQQLRFELRLRFLPKGLHEMMQVQMVAYLYLWEQLLADYVKRIAWRVDNEKAIAMAAIALRKRFSTINSQNVEKRLEFNVIEAEGGLLRYLPESLVVSSKKKQLQKSLIAAVRKVAHLSELECIFHFMKQLRSITRFDTEVFRVAIGTSWSRPVELFVGPHFGIAYKNENTKEIITIPTIAMAESLAHLLDGYQMLTSQQASVWSWIDLRRPMDELEVPRRRSPETLSPLVRRRGIVQQNPMAKVDVESTSSALAQSLHLDPAAVQLEELLGSGQYGNVYRGLYTRHGKRTPVAVKVGKAEVAGEESIDADRLLLEEACTMSRFDHEHVIRLLGVVRRNAVWVVLELAPLGELRQYLRRERETLEFSTQLLFARQIASAVGYLHARQHVHRDIAARNVLVSSPQCVKISDFGMSRLLEGDFYTSSNTKLPLKWLPVESLNERKFTTKSDVYSLGVLIWEIQSFGEKPWQGVRNHEVVTLLEHGDVLGRPVGCPLALYELLVRMWRLKAEERPKIGEVRSALDSFANQLESGVSAEELVLIPEHAPAIAASPFKAHLSELPVDELQQTLAQQRAQAEADERWLQDQEQEMFASDPSVGEPPQTSIRTHGEYVYRLNDPIHEAAGELLHATSEWSREFEKSKEKFTKDVEQVLFQLEQLLAVSLPHRELLDQPHKQRVVAVEGLLTADGNRLRATLTRILDSNWGQRESAEFTREVFRLCCVLGANCRRFLEGFDDARLASGVPLCKRDS
ncbi:hypothetical protein M3Y99_01163000 [Aphelenchoides fujianensis]|nr:hypothetical protein M3Y99_01163000 [Aphelenchoides fujianensis]